MSSHLRLVIPTWTVKGADSGIKTFLTELVVALQSVEGVDLVLLCDATNRKVFEPLCRPGRATIREVVLRGPASLRPLSEQLLARSIEPSWGHVLVVPSNVGLVGARLPQVVISQNALTLGSARPPGAVPTGQSRAHKVYFDTLGRWSLRRADAVVAVTEWMRDQVIASVPRIDPSRVHVVHEGVRVPDPLPPRSHVGPTRVLFSSSLWPYKGATLLVDALAELERKQPELDWECRFIGKDPSGGAELGRLNDAVARHGLGRRVTIVGNVAFGDIWQEYVDADVLAYPSLLESFGLPALEAMACATVVVASDIPALREVVGDAGVLVDPRDTSAFADELVEVVGSPARRQQLVEAGRRRAAEMTWDATAEGVVAAARAVVARTRTGDSRK